MTLLATKNWFISDENIASQSRHNIQHDFKRNKFPGFMFPQVVETLVRRGGMTNHHSILYLLSQICQKLAKSVDVH